MQYTLIIYGQKHMIYARDLSIAWSDKDEYWSWLPLRYDISRYRVLISLIYIFYKNFIMRQVV